MGEACSERTRAILRGRGGKTSPEAFDGALLLIHSTRILPSTTGPGKQLGLDRGPSIESKPLYPWNSHQLCRLPFYVIFDNLRVLHVTCLAGGSRMDFQCRCPGGRLACNSWR